MAARRLIWIALALSGCFSGADFSDCPQGDECGEHHTCVSGECVPNFELEPDALRLDLGRPEAGPRPDQGQTLDEVDLRREPLGEDLDYPGKRLILGRNAITTRLITIRAAEIVIDGPIEANGVGSAPGGGGGGGSGGSTTYRASGGAGGNRADPGRGASGLPGGAAGLGGRGVGALGGQGGLPGTSNMPNGGNGEDARFIDGNPCAPENQGLFQPGNGGGGGGGGRGANGIDAMDICRTGGGGGGGGTGGPGGGAIALEATQRVIIRSAINARGEPGATSEPTTAINGGPTCGSASDCSQNCDEDNRSAVGGQGSDNTGPGLRGSPEAGNGGQGGAGSGGTIRVQAPIIQLEGADVKFDVRGGSMSNPGVVILEGEVRGGSPVAEGGAPLCQF